MKTGYLRQDDEGHWYLMSEKDCLEFDILSARIDISDEFEELEDLNFDFDMKFGKYRLNGGPFDIEAIMEK